MLNTINRTVRQLFAPAFTLEDLDGFPINAYNTQKSQYEEMENWFSGVVLDSQPGLEKQSKTDYYPLRINPLKRTVYKHAYMLFGEAESSATTQVITKFVPKNDGEKDLCQTTESLLADIWEENNGRSLMMENAILSQIYGGCVFKVNYTPWLWSKYGGPKEHPITIETALPKYVVLTPSAGDYYRLDDAWLVKQVTAEEAREFGYNATDEDTAYWYTEHWTKDRFIIRINDLLATKTIDNTPYVLGGINPYGIVPFVYIPHIRAGAFLGLNVIDPLKGLIKELNLRMGDYGDAVNDDAHPVIAMHDVNGTPRMVSITDWLEVVDLQETMNMTGNENSPNMFEVRRTHASSSMKDLVEQILNEYRRDAFVPAVADGEDEGSQRSGMTLATRFWPLISHTATERFFWTPGLNWLQQIILTILKVKNLDNVTESNLKLKIKQQWAPQLPRDREAQVNEWNLRRTSEIASIEHLIEMSGDVEDVQQERANILKDIEEIETIKAKILKEYAPAPTFPTQNPAAAKKKPAGGK